VTLAALAYSERLSAGKPPRDALYQYGVAASGLATELLVLGVVLWIAWGLDRKTLGLRAPRSWGRALGLALALLVVVLVIENLLESVLHATREQGLEPTHWEPARAVPFALNAAVVALVAPFVEELTYRGLGFAALERFGAVVAVLGTAVAFAAAHGLIEGFPALFVFGVAIGILRLRTGSVFPGMLFHAFFNGVALGLAFVR
jgi:membrane protease YdiL (CAAX protease family)